MSPLAYYYFKIMENVKKSFKELQLQKMGDEEVKKNLEEWFENVKHTMSSIDYCGFEYDKGPIMEFCRSMKDDGVNHVDSHTVMENSEFNVPETIRVKLIVAYTSFADTYKLRHGKTPGSYTLYNFKDIDTLVKFVRVFMNILDNEYGEIKFEEW